MNFAFYVSGSATRLKKILDDNKTEFLSNVRLVFSDDEQNAFLKERLDAFGIKFILYSYRSINAEKSQKNLILSNELCQALHTCCIDYCFSFGAHILKGLILDEFRNRIINFHPSLLPSYPGLKAIDQAMDDHVFLLGNTAHFINAGVDSGPIIMQSVTSSQVFFSGGYDAVLDNQIEILYKIYPLLMADRIHVRDNKALIEGADYDFHYLFPSV